MNAVVTRLSSLTDLETLIRAGIPAITSQSFVKEELTGAGYGTAGHLMAVTGFTAEGDVIAHDPASPVTTPYAGSTGAPSGRRSGSVPSATTRAAQWSPAQAASATCTGRPVRQPLSARRWRRSASAEHPPGRRASDQRLSPGGRYRWHCGQTTGGPSTCQTTERDAS
jgi:hypothetical protein